MRGRYRIIGLSHRRRWTASATNTFRTVHGFSCASEAITHAMTIDRQLAMRVHVEIDHTDVETDDGQMEGLYLVCARCGHEVKVAGTTGASARRGAIMLREECPKGESNFYDVEYWEQA